MAAGQAEQMFRRQPEAGPVAIVDRDGLPRWHPLWEGNPAVWVPTPPLKAFREPYVVTGGGCLPYLEYPYTVDSGWRYTTWRVRDCRPRLYLRPEELALGESLLERYGPFILLEPTAPRKGVNRQPDWGLWVPLARRLEWQTKLPVLQLHHPDAMLIPGLPHISHNTFRDACGILMAAALLVTTEGGLVHAAAALGVPTVAMYGGSISVDALGYPEHINLVYDNPRTPCGSLLPCEHCREGWTLMTPELVSGAAAMALLAEEPHGVT